MVLATLALAAAEPPVPSSQYLPSNQYGPPSSSYGAPGFGGQTTAILRPSNQYGAPSRPNNQYGAPRPGGDYLPPNGGGYGGGNGGYGGGNGGYDDQSVSEILSRNKFNLRSFLNSVPSPHDTIFF